MNVALLTARSRTSVAETTVLRLREVHRQARLIARRNLRGHDVEDLAQRATVRYWETFGEGRGPASLQGWLKRNLDRLGLEGRPTTTSAADVDADVELRHLANPFQVVVRKDVLHRALGRLESRDLRVLRMRLSGYSSHEVAQNLRTTPLVVDQSYARAKHRLKLVIAAEPELQRQLRSGVPTRWRPTR